MMAVKIVKWISAWWVVKDAKLVEGIFALSVKIESDGVTSDKQGLAAKYSFKMAASEVHVEVSASFEMNFFRIAGT